MLPDIIEYLLSLRQHGEKPGIFNRAYQVIIPNFPPLISIRYTVSPAIAYAYILYEWTFGQAVVPHSFDVKVDQGGDKLFDAIVSGRFTTDSAYSFALVTTSHPVDITVTNLRTLANYYEATTFYLSIPTEEAFKIVIDALERMNTSAKSEALAEETNRLLRNVVALLGGEEAPLPSIGRRQK